MSKVLFFKWNVSLDYQTVYSACKELVKEWGRGFLFFSTAGFKEKIEASGASFVGTYGNELSRGFSTVSGLAAAIFFIHWLNLWLGMDRVVIPLVIEKD
jgi:hypothetical protein